MKNSIVFTGLVLALCSWTQGQTCVASSRQSSDLTRFGGNELITVIERKPRARVRGRVTDVNGSPVKYALVEIYENPSWLLKSGLGPDQGQKRIIGCEVGKAGQFEIRGLKKNDYELRVSVSIGFNVTHMFISVDPRRGTTKRLELSVSPGT